MTQHTMGVYWEKLLRRTAPRLCGGVTRGFIQASASGLCLVERLSSGSAEHSRTVRAAPQR